MQMLRPGISHLGYRLFSLELFLRNMNSKETKRHRLKVKLMSNVTGIRKTSFLISDRCKSLVKKSIYFSSLSLFVYNAEMREVAYIKVTDVILFLKG